MDARKPTFPFYVVRDAAAGGGVISMHWSRATAERKLAKLADDFAHVVPQADFHRLPLHTEVVVSSGDPTGPARGGRR